MIFFCKLLTIVSPFQVKKEKLKFFSKFQNIFENVIFDQKTAKLATLQNREHRFNKLLSDSESEPKIQEVRCFLGSYIFFVDQCYGRNISIMLIELDNGRDGKVERLLRACMKIIYKSKE